MIDFLEGLPGWLAVSAVAVVVAAEPAVLVGVLLPSVASTVFLGFLSGLGVLPLEAAVLTAGGAAAAGDALAFRAGRRRSWRPTSASRPARALARGWRTATDLYARVGWPAVAAARWVTVARTVVPRLAGRSGMPWWRFLALAVPSALLWSGVLVGGGRLAGASYAEFSRYVGRGGSAVLVLALLTAVAVTAGRRIRRHRDAARSTATTKAGPAAGTA